MSLHIALDGTPNFRDLGGCKNNKGQRVKHGAFYRSGELSRLTESDLTKIAEFNITTICDFRRLEEAAREPTAISDARKLSLAIDPGSQTSALNEASDQSQIHDMSEFMCDINAAFALQHVAAYKSFLEAIDGQKSGEALLFHCSAGKDRTGFAAALILMILDVPREVILQDYMLTEKHFDVDVELPRLVKKYAGHRFASVDPAQFRPVLEVRPSYLQTAFSTIDEKYATEAEYLDDVFAINRSTRERWQSIFMQ